MGRTLQTVLTAVFVLFSVLLVGCASTPKSGESGYYEGKLEGGIAAIGGETTGWRLITAGVVTGRTIELDVSRVREQAEELEGTFVEVGGFWETREYVERGDVLVFNAVTMVRSRADDPLASPGAPAFGGGGGVR